MSDQIRAAIMSCFISGAPVAKLVFGWDVSTTDLAYVELFVGNVTLLFALIFKKGQLPGPDAHP